MEEIVVEAGTNWQAIASILGIILGGGGVVYLVIEKLFGRKKDNAETGGINQQNNMSAVEMYQKMDAYVEEKIDKYGKRTEERLSKMESRVETLERLKCFNTECRKREYFPPTPGNFTNDEMVSKRL